MNYRTLGKTGLRVSALSFGGSSLGGVFRTVTETECLQTVRTALDGGINFIDVSPYYGITKAETMLGKALAGVPRESYYLATKVGRYGDEEFDFSPARVVRSIDESLKRLGTDYLDIVQCHDIEFGSLREIANETLPALRRVQATGKVRFVGITGFPLKVFSKVLAAAKVDTILSYGHFSLNDDSLLDLMPELTRRDVGVVNASPLSMGLLSRRGTPEWHPAGEVLKAGCREAVAACDDAGLNIEKLAVQFSLSHPEIHTTLVGTANPRHLLRNIAWADDPIDQEELSKARELLAPVYRRTWSIGRQENN